MEDAISLLVPVKPPVMDVYGDIHEIGKQVLLLGVLDEAGTDAIELSIDGVQFELAEMVQ